MKLVLVKTGGLFVRVHPSKLILKTRADEQINKDGEQNAEELDREITVNNEHVHKNSECVYYSSSDESSDDEDTELSTDTPVVSQHPSSCNIESENLPMTSAVTHPEQVIQTVREPVIS